jgi:putative ABC transport system permease protein
MNLAVRDIRRHMMRFLLTCVGLGMLLTVVMAMSGIYRGLVADSTRVINAVPAQLWIVEQNTRGPFAENSRLPEDLQYTIAAVRGVRQASPLSYQYVQIPHRGKPVRLMLIGYRLGGLGGPVNIVAGRPILKKHYEIVVDQKSGYSLGEVIHLGLENYSVVGLTKNIVSPSGDPVGYLSLLDAQTVQFQLDNDAIRNNRQRLTATYAPLSRMSSLLGARATRQAISAGENVHFVNAVVAELNPAAQPNEVATHIGRWNHYQVFSSAQESDLLLRGFIEKSKKQLWLFRIILMLVSGVIIALIIYTLTMDKLREIATLKIIGAPDRTIISLILEQSLAMGVLGFALGYLLISQTYTLYPRTVILQRLDMGILLLVVVLVCILSSLLGIWRALKVDPSTALGGGGG